MFDNIFDYGYKASFKSTFDIFLKTDKKVDRKLSLDFFHKIEPKISLI